jgi:hypothetical protein
MADAKSVNISTATIAAILTALAGAGGTAAVTMQSAAIPQLSAAIKGPQTAAIGKLVSLKADAPGATQLRWYPETDGTSHVCEGGDGMVATSDVAGEREFVLFASNGTSSVVAVHRVSFGLTPTPKPDDCPPDVVPPRPTPDPKPDPQPDPAPTFGLAKSVPEWLAKVPAASRGQSGDIAAVYREIGQKAAESKFAVIIDVEAASSAAILKLVTDGKIDAQAWRPFGESLNAAFTGLRAVGRITTAKEYGQAMLEVAGAL